MDMIQGRVIRARTSFYDVQDGGAVLRCQLRGRVKRAQRSAAGRQIYADPVAVGDEVIVTPLDNDEGVIEEILPRRTKFSRRYPGKRDAIEQIVVANVDQVVTVLSTRLPDLNYRFLDRFLILAEVGEINAVVCINKVDLIDAVEERRLGSILNAYEQLGYPVIFTSINYPQSIEAFREALRDKFSVIVGASGVGKSSLLNAVQPGLGLRVGEVGLKTGKGRHTTTLVELFCLDFGGQVADTPGIREVGLWGVDTENIDLYFPEMESYLGKCKYTDCVHLSEPGCAVTEAVNVGEISDVRYLSYVSLRNEENIEGSSSIP
ncbi:ribosome small subunit-dependent GTPase A [Candidatus Poribacteria bacterium]|nr:ribosome small subunit-dependent GTPase A [Candidatus Poribacteria bacterium]